MTTSLYRGRAPVGGEPPQRLGDRLRHGQAVEQVPMPGRQRFDGDDVLGRDGRQRVAGVHERLRRLGNAGRHLLARQHVLRRDLPKSDTAPA
jgi:hypothetical protein